MKNKRIFKRFVKGLSAALISQALLYSASVLPELNLLSATLLPVVVALLLALEKGFQKEYN